MVSSAALLQSYQTIAEQFAVDSSVKGIEPLGNGNINDTFLVTLADSTRFVLQRINQRVFPEPQALMGNMVQVTEHIARKLETAPLSRPWRMPSVIKSRAGENFWWDQSQQSCWRAISFIGETEALETVGNPAQATEVGAALGIFHRLLSDLNPESLRDTLPGFHQTPQYLAQYQVITKQTMADESHSLGSEIRWCHEFIAERAGWCSVLETAKAKGELPLRLMHGDPKVNNILFDPQTEQAVSIIDLDTTKPGLIHYDIGDCIRSSCNPAGEETQDWQAVEFNLDYCQAFFQGYLPQCQSFLTPVDYDYLFDALRLIAFELGLRFFTDFLAGNIYFKTHYPENNLYRALVQFHLTQCIEAEEAAIGSIIFSTEEGLGK